MNLEVTLNTEATHASAILDVTGDLDYTTTGAMVEAVRTLLLQRPTLEALYLDCTELDYCDSAGLAGLLAVHDLTQTAGVRLHLDNRSTQLDRLLDLTGVGDYLLASTAEMGSQESHAMDTRADESDIG